MAVGESVTMTVSSSSVSLTEFDVSWFVDEDPSVTAPSLTGSSATYAYDYPGRYRVIATLAPRAGGPAQRAVAYLNVFRPREQTVYGRSDGAWVRQDTAVIGTPGSGDWCHHSYDVFRGKYYELWVQQDHEEPPSAELQRHALTFVDRLHDVYTEMFGWDLRSHREGQKVVFCDDVAGAGGGAGGTFTSRVREDATRGGLDAGSFGTLVHELIHQWDFRGGVHLAGADSAHALTSSIEYLALTALGAPFVARGGHLEPVSPYYHALRIERIMSHRYLGADGESWATVYDPAILELPYNDLPLPENKEHMLVMGGALSAFHRMHGPDGLRAYFEQIDQLLLEHPEWEDGVGAVRLPDAQRTENMLIAMSRAVGYDVSGYFEAWKFPVSEAARAAIAGLPESPMLQDRDGDGFSPADGDIDDCRASVYPGADELDDGRDNNQDGLLDERVHDEARDGDVEELSVELPFFFQGRISDLGDADVFRFTVPEGQVAVVATLTLTGDEEVPLTQSGRDADRPNRLFSGRYDIPGNGQFASVRDYYHIFGQHFIVRGTGEEQTLRVSTDAHPDADTTPNPGAYELQVFISDAPAPRWTAEDLLPLLYP